MSGLPPVTLVGCDLFGTTVDDGGLLDRAFTEACATQGIVPGTAAYAHSMVVVHQARGQAAVDVFRGLFEEGEESANARRGRAEAAALSFERSFRAAVDRSGLSPVPGAERVIGQLREAGIRVCLLTGLSRRLLTLVLDTVGWMGVADLVLCHDDVPRGSPWPDLMLCAMLRLGVGDVTQAAFAGGTVSGIRTGKRAGAGIVAGVLAGGHTADRLREAGATHLIDGITGLPALLGADSGPVNGLDGPGAAAAAGGISAAPPAASVPRVPLERRDLGL